MSDPHERERGEHNEIGYRNADEQADYDESGSQGPSGDREHAREQTGDTDRPTGEHAG
jgi:hypothetical protein